MKLVVHLTNFFELWALAPAVWRDVYLPTNGDSSAPCLCSGMRIGTWAAASQCFFLKGNFEACGIFTRGCRKLDNSSLTTYHQVKDVLFVCVSRLPVGPKAVKVIKPENLLNRLTRLLLPLRRDPQYLLKHRYNLFGGHTKRPPANSFQLPSLCWSTSTLPYSSRFYRSTLSTHRSPAA